MIHELKIESRYLHDIEERGKTFELRKHDRNYKVGDYLHLRGVYNGKYTGREIVKQISYIHEGNDKYGLKKGFSILGLEPIL